MCNRLACDIERGDPVAPQRDRRRDSEAQMGIRADRAVHIGAGSKVEEHGCDACPGDEIAGDPQFTLGEAVQDEGKRLDEAGDLEQDHERLKVGQYAKAGRVVHGM